MKICIVGAGPAGLLLAQHLIGRPNYELHLFEAESFNNDNNPRIYPIALQGRGMSALRQVEGLEEKLRSSGKWMDSVSFVTSPKGKPNTMKRPKPSFMIQQKDLQSTLLHNLQQTQPFDSTSSLSMHFDTPVEALFLHNRTLLAKHAEQTSLFTFDHVVACDGVDSKLRNRIAAQPDSGLVVKRKSIPGGYKTLVLHTDATEKKGDEKSNDGETLDPNSVHGVMFKTQNFLAVPLRDPSTVSGVYAFTEDPDPLQNITTAENLLEFFKTNVPSLAKLMTSQDAASFLERPTQRMCTVACNSLIAGPHQEAVLLGDAGHVFSASLNQGCNAALQDVQILIQCLNECHDDWSQALVAYNKQRFQDIQAAHELSNYALPKTAWQRVEFMARMIGHKVAPWLVPPLPMELLYDETLSYQQILSKCQGWIDRVKRSTTEDDLTTENFAKVKQKLLKP